MNRMLLIKAAGDARGLVLAMGAMLFAFNWLFVWLNSTIELGAYEIILRNMPAWFDQLLGMPIDVVATPLGRLSMAYVHPVVAVSLIVWGVARGSDGVSGEIDRGTMEWILAQGVRRWEVVASQGLATALGSVVLAACCWLGTAAGLATVPLDEPLAARDFLPGVVNAAAMSFFVGGGTMLLGSLDRYRWRTIGLAGGFCLVQLILKLIGRIAPGGGWVLYLTFLGPFEPQRIIVSGEAAWSEALRLSGPLVGLGLAAYIAAAVVFARRDIPAPL